MPATILSRDASIDGHLGEVSYAAPAPEERYAPPRLQGMDWPLFDLRLSIGDVALCPVSDADLPAIDAMFPDDDEQDPRWEHFAGLSAQRNRHRLLVQRT